MATLVTMVAIYSVLITLDGYVLAPLLVSEAVDLHPVAVLVAILFFGGMIMLLLPLELLS